jgi:GST-like protein
MDAVKKSDYRSSPRERGFERPQPAITQEPRMAIDLYAYGTPNGRKISVALEEMELPYTVHVVNIIKGEQHDPAFLKISPNNKIPAIVDPDGPGGAPISVFESGAILIYLGEKTGRFWPRDLRSRVPVLDVGNEQDRRYGLERFMKETLRLYRVMDRRLADHEFFADEISIADFAIVGWAWRHPRHKVDLADYPNVKRWYETMMARPGVRRGFEVALS